MFKTQEFRECRDLPEWGYAAMADGSVVTAVTTLASVVVGALLTNLLNAGRSTDEKLWELRRIAYGSILAELKAVEWVLESADECISEDEYRYFDAELSRRHNETMSNHMQVVRKSYLDNYLTMSDRFIAVFEDFLRSLDDRDPNLMPPEEHEKFADAVRAARPKLLQQARSEMPLRRGLLNRVRGLLSRK